MAVVDTAANILDGQREAPGVDVTNSKNAAETAKRSEAEQVYDLQRLLTMRIEQLQAEAGGSMSPEIAAQIAEMKSAVGSRNLTVLSLVFISTSQVSNKVAAENAAEFDAAYLDAERHVSSFYPDFAEYSKEARAFISRQILDTYEKSPTFRAISDKFDALPEAAKSQAISTQREQEQRWKALQNDPIFDGPMGINAKKLIDDFDVFKSARFEKIEDLINQAKNGRNKDEVMADILRIAATEMAQQIRVGDAVVKEMLPGMDTITKKIFADKFPGNDGMPNMSAAISAWHNISMGDRNEATREFEKHGRDMSKLSPEHQKTMALFKVMSGASAANALQATTKMAHNIELEAVLKDKEHDPSGEKRVDAIMKFMRENEGTASDRGMSRAFAKDIVELIDRDPSAFALLKSGEEKDLREIGVRIATHKKVKNADDFAVSYIRESRDDYYNRVLSGNPPDWLKNDAVRLQEERKNAQEWVATSSMRSAMLEANGVTPAEVAAAAANPQATVRGDAAIMAETKDFMKEYNEKKLAQQQEEAALAQKAGSPPAASPAAVVAATVISPPPGIDPKDIPLLRGVTAVAQPSNAEQGEPKGHLVAMNPAAIAPDISAQAH